MVEVLSKAIDPERLNALVPGFRRTGFGKEIANVQKDVAALAVANNALAAAPAPVNVLAFASNPTTGQTRTIGSDTYEFLAAAEDTAAEGNIAVLIGETRDATMVNFVEAVNAWNAANQHASIFNGDGETPALANGTENALAIADQTNHKAYILQADKPGGTVVPGNPASLVFGGTSAATSWLFSNFTAFPLVLATQRVGFGIEVTSALLAATQPLRVRVPFEPQGISWQARGTRGERKDVYIDAKAVEESGQWLLELNLNDTAPSRTDKLSVTLAAGDSTSNAHQKTFGRPVRIPDLKVTIPDDDTGGSLTVTINKVTDGTRTALASNVNIGGASPRVPYAITGLTTPFTLTALEDLELVVAGGMGLTAPTSVTFQVDVVETLADGDVLTFDLWG